VKYTFVGAAFAAAISAAPAQAQPVAADLLPAYEVTAIIASMGMRPIGRPAWMRGRYVVAAIDRNGREVNVILDARDGQVLAVRPLARDSFGAPPPGYATRPAPYDPMDGRAPPPASGPGTPLPDDDEFFDNDQQHGALPQRAPVRAAPSRDPAVTGSVPRSAPAQRKDVTKDQTPTPRPRPALAKANDPGNKPGIAPTDKPAAAAKPDEKKPEAKAKAEAQQAATPQSAKPGEAKPEIANKPDGATPDVRVIDLSKPKVDPKPEDKPGEAIRF